MQRLTDPEPLIQIQAARPLAGIGDTKSALPTVRRLLEHKDQIIQLRAALVVDECDLASKAPAVLSTLTSVRGQYGKRVAKWIVTSSGEPE